MGSVEVLLFLRAGQVAFDRHYRIAKGESNFARIIATFVRRHPLHNFCHSFMRSFPFRESKRSIQKVRFCEI